uniref:Uncharacterized protein n=1 Tax=Arundo donax TaxID=35708 RepID=A0A0A8XX76_ARUDO
MPTGDNGATVASGTGPASGYTLNLLWFLILFMLSCKLNMNTYSVVTRSLMLCNIMFYIEYFRIKICHNLPKFPTI